MTLTQTFLFRCFDERGMPYHKIEAIRREFPFVDYHLPGEPIRSVYVQMVDSEILSHVLDSRVDQRSWLEFGTVDEFFLFLDQNGRRVRRDWSLTVERRTWWSLGLVRRKRAVKATFSGQVAKGSRIVCALALLGEETDRVRFMLSYHPYTQVVIVYKVPRGKTLRQVVEEAREEERRKFGEECEVLDAPR